MSNETSKAMRRRWCEAAQSVFPWKRIFTGRGLDIGCGPDPLQLPNVTLFDTPQGDANQLHTYFDRDSFHYIHASQSLEHMHTPEVLWKWLTLVRVGGYAIITVPSWELYEYMQWPSRYNPDHKSTWSMNLRGSPAPIHIHVPTWLEGRSGYRCLLMRQLDINYDYKVGMSRDQTWIEADGVEPWIEFVLQRLQ